jgi:hypothetical protein
LTGHINVQDDDREGAEDVNGRHQRDDLLCRRADALEAAEEDQREKDREGDSGDEPDDAAVNTCGIGGEGAHRGRDDARDRVALRHVADAERGEGSEEGEGNGEPFPVFAEPVRDVVHRAAGPFALRVPLAVPDRENDLAVFRAHAEEGRDPHPEDGSRPAERDGSGDSGYVAGSDRRGEGRGHGLEGGDRSLVARLLSREGLSDRVLHGPAEMPELDRAGSAKNPYADSENQGDRGDAPYDAIYC